jgi:Tfp pilus assembly protein PilO
VRKSRRQIANRIIEATGAALVALDLVVFFAIYRPLGNKLAAETHRQAELRQAIRNQQVRVDALKKFEAAASPAGKGLEDFMANRTPSRREAFSSAAHLIHKLADASGVKISNLGYRLDTEHHDPLERLMVDIAVEGPYPSLIKFSHALETANDFILIREFDFAPGNEPGAVGLRLGAELFLIP